MQCLRLARAIVQGEMLAISREDYARMVSTYYAAQLPAIETLRGAAPEVQQDEGPVLATPDGTFQVRVRFQENEPKVVASGDAGTMKQVWRAYTKNRPGLTVELFDVTLQHVRGTR